ncbi:MAG: ABC transporter permease [Actinobacteria bacterium]|nr:ABC transporter permease [Actinomycetota bacterium]
MNTGDFIGRIGKPKPNPISVLLSILGNARLFIVIILIVAVFSIINPSYFSVNSLYSIFMSITVIGFAVIGQTFCLLAGGFDLSVGAITLMSGVTAAYLIENFGINIWFALLIVILEGAIIGAINGLIITKVKINPLITTLAMSSILTGLVYFFTEGKYISVREESFRFLGVYRLFNIKFLQLSIVIIIALFIIFFIVLKYTYYGKYIYAIGGNKVSAKFSGININLIETSVYIMSGAMCAIGGYIFASRVGAAQYTIGGFFPLLSVTAAILGGISLAGGKGSILGSLFGILILQSLNIGLIGLGLETYFQNIANGVVLLLAVFFDLYLYKRR